MKLYLGADHGGFELKQKLHGWLDQQGYVYEDCGAIEFDSEDDYPQYALAVAQKVAAEPQSRGILLCRSGGGMTIMANKVAGVRAVEATTVVAAAHAREHNNATIVTLSADWTDFSTICEILQTFVSTSFSSQERHHRRVSQIIAFEQSQEKGAL